MKVYLSKLLTRKIQISSLRVLLFLIKLKLQMCYKTIFTAIKRMKVKDPNLGSLTLKTHQKHQGKGNQKTLRGLRGSFNRLE